MGSNVSTADEWVEVGAFGSEGDADVNLSGWTLATVKAGVETVIATFPSVALNAGSHFVVANFDAAHSRLLLEPGMVTTGMSLPNTQLLLRLRDSEGTLIDEIDDGVGAPFAGANPSGGAKASMERVDSSVAGNISSNWKTAMTTSGFDEGPAIFGTPAISEALTPVCSIPTPEILIQSRTAKTGRLTLNLEAGGTNGGSCSWMYPDGFQSGSCNPPVHAMSGPLSGDVFLSVTDNCGNTVTQSLHVEIQPGGDSFDEAFSVFTCTPVTFSGVVLSEFVSNPVGDEEAGEWIEIENISGKDAPLCGWFLDDGERGSDPYPLERLRLPIDEKFVLDRSKTGIALNNDHDAVRLIAPIPGGGSGSYDVRYFSGIAEGKSLAKRIDGNWIETTPTPWLENSFPEPKFRTSVPAEIVQVKPNPIGIDEGREWFELLNTTRYPIALTGWKVRTKSDEMVFGSFILAPKERKRIFLEDDSFILANTNGVLQLFDHTDALVSTLAWKKSMEGIAVRRVEPASTVTDLTLVTLLSCTQWSVKDVDEHVFTIEISGSIPGEELRCVNFVSALLKGKKFDLEMYSDSACHGELDEPYTHAVTLRRAQGDTEKCAGVPILNGVDVTSLLIRNGVALLDSDDPSYGVLEEEARDLKLGFWASPERVAMLDEARMKDTWRQTIADEGFEIEVSKKEGIVDEGEEIEITTNIPARIVLMSESGALMSAEPKLRIDRDTSVRIVAIADVESSTGGIIQSTIDQSYIVRRSHYDKLFVSEVAPSPQKGESEWIEIFNPTDRPMPLAGWLLDDAKDAGSKPVTLSANAVIGPREFLTIDGLTIAWNNDGDDVRLIDPNGKISSKVSYDTTKKGRTVAWLYSDEGRVKGQCETTHPTRGESNRCASELKKKASKKTAAKARKSKRIARHKVRYKNLVAESGALVDVDPLFKSLLLDSGEAGQPRWPYGVLALLVAILTFLSILGGIIFWRQTRY